MTGLETTDTDLDKTHNLVTEQKTTPIPTTQSQSVTPRELTTTTIPSSEQSERRTTEEQGVLLQPTVASYAERDGMKPKLQQTSSNSSTSIGDIIGWFLFGLTLFLLGIVTVGVIIRQRSKEQFHYFGLSE